MKLHTLKLQNFMGIRDFTLDAQGEDVAVYADNGVGKTTIFSAFTWLLRDKDSQNRKDFELKTIGPDGRAFSGLEHSVEGVFELEGGRKITLKKIYKEVWTRKRGAPKASFSGHTTDHFIDGVPMEKKYYQDQIKTLVPDEEVFMLLTNPRYFNDQLHWEKRRQVLLEVCGDVTTEEVVEVNPELAKLPGLLEGRSIDDYRKVLASRQREVNNSLKQIPVRIDEVARALPDLEGIDKTAHENAINLIGSIVEDKDTRWRNLVSGGGAAELRTQIAGVKADMAELKNSLIAEHQQAQAPASDRRREINSAIKALDESIRDIKDHIARNEMLKEPIVERIEIARKDWHTADARVFEYTPDENCPTCGQSLPADQVEATREKALHNFNLEKARVLTDISERGKHYKSALVSHDARLAEAADQLQAAETELSELMREWEALPVESAAAPVDLEADPEYKALTDKLKGLEGQLVTLDATRGGQISALQAEIAEMKQKLRESEAEMAKFEQHAQGLKRIEELKAQERELAAEFEGLEAEQHLLDQFTRAKVNLLDAKINEHFELARFKMFDENINGGLEPTCETLYNNVPWGGGLNNGAQLNVGVDIINTLADHYKFYPPIIVDNAESVTKLIPAKGQLIKLLVSEQDKSLRVENL